MNWSIKAFSADPNITFELLLLIQEAQLSPLNPE